MPPQDVQRLRDEFAAGRLLPPHAADAGPPSAVDLAQALAFHGGAPDLRLSPAARTVATAIGGPLGSVNGSAIGDAEQLVFVLVDGLGCNLLDALPPASFLRRRLALELRAVFPSATAPALTSLATAAWPAQHAVPGWFTYLPEHDLTATILPFVERFSQTPLGDRGVTPASAFPFPAILPRFARSVRGYHPAAIADSAYTRYQLGGAARGYDSLSGAIAATIDGVQRAGAPGFHYLYLPQVDGAAHRHGHDAPAVQRALEAVDAGLARLAKALDGRARIVVSADHGMITVPEAAKHVIRPDDPLMATLIVPPSGEPRAPMFHVRPGAQRAFVARFREALGAWFALLTIEEADDLALFGPARCDARARARIGDFIAVAPGPDVLIYEHAAPSGIRALRGYHGGLSPAEMRIPLILA